MGGSHAKMLRSREGDTSSNVKSHCIGGGGGNGNFSALRAFEWSHKENCLIRENVQLNPFNKQVLLKPRMKRNVGHSTFIINTRTDLKSSSNAQRFLFGILVEKSYPGNQLKQLLTSASCYNCQRY